MKKLFILFGVLCLIACRPPSKNRETITSRYSVYQDDLYYETTEIVTDSSTNCISFIIVKSPECYIGQKVTICGKYVIRDKQPELE